MDKIGEHLTSGAKMIIISAPSTDTIMFTMSIKHEKYHKSLKIVSNIFAPPLFTTLPQANGIWTQSMPSLPLRRLWTAPLESCNSCWAAQNVIPASTGAAKTVDKFVPELNQKLTGMVFHTSILSLFIMYLACPLEKASKYDNIKKVVKQALKDQ